MKLKQEAGLIPQINNDIEKESILFELEKILVI